VQFGYSQLAIFLAAALVFGIGALLFSWLLRPYRPSDEKRSTYECGEQPVGSAWVQFNTQYYVIALLYVIFAVEALFVAPWAAQYRSLIERTGPFAFVEMLIFLAVLALGLVYAWGKGVLRWL
jgi:NADH-quinone oxidoreductase subunit A